MDDMNDLESYELRPLDAINNSGLWMIWLILGREPMVPNSMNNSGMWITWMTSNCELRDLDAMNNLGLSLTWMTLGRDFNTLNSMHSSRLWMIWTTWDPMNLGLYMVRKAQGCGWYENDSWLWDHGSKMLWTTQAHHWHERLWVMSSRL